MLRQDIRRHDFFSRIQTQELLVIETNGDDTRQEIHLTFENIS